MLDVRKLGMLIALDRLGTISAVAEELHLTAPGISMQLAALERELGVALTVRQGRRLALTPAGRLLSSHGRAILERLLLAELDIDALRKGTAGTYRVAAFPSAARTFIADVWRSLIDDDSDLAIEVTTPEPEGALAALVAGEADLAVVHSYSNVPRALPVGIQDEHLVTEAIWVAIRQDDPAAQAEVHLSALEDHRWITPRRGTTCFEMTDRACGLAGYRPQIVAETMDFAAQLELVAAGVGVALVPDLTVSSVSRGVRVARPEPALHRHVSVARRTSLVGDPGLDQLTACLRDAATARLRTAAPEQSETRCCPSTPVVHRSS